MNFIHVRNNLQFKSIECDYAQDLDLVFKPLGTSLPGLTLGKNMSSERWNTW